MRSMNAMSIAETTAPAMALHWKNQA